METKLSPFEILIDNNFIFILNDNPFLPIIRIECNK